MLDTSSNRNINYQPNSNKSQTFGRDLAAYIQNKTPYGTIVDPENNQKNPKYKDFHKAGVRRAEVLSRHSITSNNEYNNTAIGAINKDSSFGDMMYANVQQNKGARLRDYRVIASYSEVAEALDEICDEVINTDENGKEVVLSFSKVCANDNLTPSAKERIEEEFIKYVTFFDLKNKGWQYFRQLLIEGELFFEQIIHNDHKDKGILGVINIPAEVVDPVYQNIQNMLLKGFIYRKPVFNKNNPTKIESIEFVPMDDNQIVYINSGTLSDNKSVVLPFLENARRPYRQLSLIEDSIVIYRLVRAPERLVFNVDTGNMPPPKAEAYMRKLIQEYWANKTFDMDQADIVKKYNPQSMLDAFWFAKRSGSEGTKVEQLPGGANLGQLDDLNFFVKKLYRALKVPTTRLNPDEGFKDGSEILREELKFAKFIVRQQSRFAAGIKKGFITHLKLRQLWEELSMKETDFEIAFNVPTNFYELRENQRLELKSNNYNTIAGNEFVSATYAQKKYLGWSDTDILANREFLRKDAELTWEMSQIQTMGPGWKEALITGQAPQGAEDQNSPGGFDIQGGTGLPAGGSSPGGIPEFGGEAATQENTPDEVANVGNEEAPKPI